jgi:hypothetical protein
LACEMGEIRKVPRGASKRPVTPEAAGSSPVRPAEVLEGYKGQDETGRDPRRTSECVTFSSSLARASSAQSRLRRQNRHSVREFLSNASAAVRFSAKYQRKA